MLRKLSSWSSQLSAGPLAWTGESLDYVALTGAAGLAASDADEVVYVEHARAPLSSRDPAHESAARWASMKHVPNTVLLEPGEPTQLHSQETAVPAITWQIGSARLLTAIVDSLLVEVWVPAYYDVHLVPLDPGDVVGLSWR
jgi:hypothetical protein